MCTFFSLKLLFRINKPTKHQWLNSVLIFFLSVVDSRTATWLGSNDKLNCLFQSSTLIVDFSWCYCNANCHAINRNLMLTVYTLGHVCTLCNWLLDKIFQLKLFSEEMLKKGFILVLDRRKDKWGAVKSCLQKIQVCNNNNT